MIKEVSEGLKVCGCVDVNITTCTPNTNMSAADRALAHGVGGGGESREILPGIGAGCKG